MAAYDYRCRECDSSVLCPRGHTEVSRVFTAVALGGGLGATTAKASAGVAPAAGGGCCGGGCCG